jgi:hypothetical protein
MTKGPPAGRRLAPWRPVECSAACRAGRTCLIAAFTGLAVIVAVISGGIALSERRQQASVIKGEVERNKKRDELIDRQIREVEQRTRSSPAATPSSGLSAPYWPSTT